jgi:hypothetical protein
MKTGRFFELIERAYTEVTSEEPVRVSVPYDPDPSDATVEVAICLGLVLMEPVHMAEVAIRACQLMVADPSYNADTFDDELDDFGAIMGTMRVLPYMNWHCVYFPGLTQEQIDAEGTGAQQLYAEFDSYSDELGISVRWYSGRGMMGKECLAIAGDPHAIQDALSTVRSSMGPIVGGLLNDFRSDELGTQSVMYWPGLPKGE